MTVADHTWFIEKYMNGDYFLGVTFVRGLSPSEALHRIGATPGDVSRDWVIEAYAADGGAVLLDYHCYEMPEVLSRGTETARLVTGTTMDEEFVYSVDGLVATRFEPSFPDEREGGDPDYLLAHMRDLGMPLDGEEFTDTRIARDLVLVLAVRATGVSLTPAHHAVPSITGSTDCPR